MQLWCHMASSKNQTSFSACLCRQIQYRNYMFTTWEEMFFSFFLFYFPDQTTGGVQFLFVSSMADATAHLGFAIPVFDACWFSQGDIAQNRMRGGTSAARLNVSYRISPNLSGWVSCRAELLLGILVCARAFARDEMFTNARRRQVRQVDVHGGGKTRQATGERSLMLTCEMNGFCFVVNCCQYPVEFIWLLWPFYVQLNPAPLL
jgi:hypothetical protein